MVGSRQVAPDQFGQVFFLASGLFKSVLDNSDLFGVFGIFCNINVPEQIWTVKTLLDGPDAKNLTKLVQSDLKGCFPVLFLSKDTDKTLENTISHKTVFGAVGRI